MKIYNYDGQTKEFTDKGYAQPNPKKDGEFLLPSNATTLEPLEPKDGFAIVWNGTSWEYVEDNRGKIWEKATAQELECELLGALDTPYTKIPPLEFKEGFKCVWKVDKWEYEELPPVVPTEITMRQCKSLLIMRGLDERVEDFLNAIPDPIAKKLAFASWNGHSVLRTDPLVNTLKAFLELTEDQVDEMFVEASKI